MRGGYNDLQDSVRYYKPKDWLGVKPQHQLRVIALFLTAAVEQYNPTMVHCTVWLSEGKSISDLTDTLGKWVRMNPIQNGTRYNLKGEVQKYRHKPRCLYAWAREVKDTSAKDCVYVSGVHYHLILIYDGHSFQKSTWPYFIMGHLQDKGIIAPHRDESNTAWHVSGIRSLDSEENLSKAVKHASYICKLDQKQTTQGKRNFGTSTHLVSPKNNNNKGTRNEYH